MLGRCQRRGTVLDMAAGPADPGRLAYRRILRRPRGLSAPHRRGVDGHAATRRRRRVTGPARHIGPVWRTVTVGGRRLRLRVKRDAWADGRPYLWPSVGEYPLYDDFLYHVMLQDEPRNTIFRKAIEERVPHTRVLEIGCGPDLLWSLYAAECGARSVRAVESIPASAARATALAKNRPQYDIEVLSGEATTVGLPERAEVCIAELVGSIGGAEGIAAVLDDVR